MSKSKAASLVPIGHVAQSIFILRGRRVLLDSDLAMLYGVDTRRLNEQVRRNRGGRPAQATTCLHGAWCHHGRHGA
jgi:hypothetical protein